MPDREGTSYRIDSEVAAPRCRLPSIARPCDRLATGIALLDILPSAEINLSEKIKVIWFGDRVPTTEDLPRDLEESIIHSESDYEEHEGALGDCALSLQAWVKWASTTSGSLPPSTPASVLSN